MRTAIIDLGTNSIRFDVHQFGPGDQIQRLHREKIMVRLGEGVFVTKKLSKFAMQRALHAIMKFKRLSVQFSVDRILAFGTSALREAEDRDVFRKLVQTECGIDLKVISGREEATLIALGVLSNEEVRKEKFALVDIGGGSTEMSICQGEKVLHSFSFPLGAARVQQLYLKKNPPKSKDMDALKDAIVSMLSTKMKQEKWPKVDLIIGSSGTVRAVAKMIRKAHGSSWIERSQLKDLISKMDMMKISELHKVPGMEPKRADIMLAGSMILDGCMEVLGARKVKASEYSLRDGVLERESRLYRQTKVNHLSAYLGAFYEQAKLFGRDELHLKRAVKTAEILFEKLQPVHKLSTEWRSYLSAATILKDLGQAINLTGHAEHSYYIIKNSLLPPLGKWEVDFIANLCRHHENYKVDRSSFHLSESQSKRGAFLKLLALLKIVDALDLGTETKLSFHEIHVKGSAIELRIAGKRLTGLENLYLERKREFFEKVLKRPVRVVAV